MESLLFPFSCITEMWQCQCHPHKKKFTSSSFYKKNLSTVQVYFPSLHSEYTNIDVLESVQPKYFGLHLDLFWGGYKSVLCVRLMQIKNNTLSAQLVYILYIKSKIYYFRLLKLSILFQIYKVYSQHTSFLYVMSFFI